MEDLLTQHKARPTDPATSHLAASKLNAKKVTKLMHDIINSLFYDGQKTDEELGQHLTTMYVKFSPSGLRSRRSELQRAGIVEPCGIKLNSLGNKCQIWRLSEVGYRAKDYMDNYEPDSKLNIATLIRMGE